MKTAFWLYVKISSSTNVVFDSCEMEFCCDRKFWKRCVESVLRKLPDWLTICQLPTEEVDSFRCRDIDEYGTVTGLVRL